MRMLLTVAVLLATQGVTCAQTRFGWAGKRHLPYVNRTTPSMAVGDFDRDGDLDLVVGPSQESHLQPADRGWHLYLNDGKGRFAKDRKGRLPAVNLPTGLVVAGDTDGDGDLDLVLATSGQNRHYRNDGGGFMTDVTGSTLPARHADTRALRLLDLDGDGDLDLVTGDDRVAGTALFNNGKGRFTDRSATALPPTAVDIEHLVVVDLEGDGDPDLLGYRDVSMGTTLRVRLVNNGSGVFTDTVKQNPTPLATSVGDIDGDGDQDLIHLGLHNTTHLQVNDGKGNFTARAIFLQAQTIPRPRTTHFADMDGDGDLDLIVGCDGQDRLFFNNGRGRFQPLPGRDLPPAWHTTGVLATGDLDGDGDLDLVAGSWICMEGTALVSNPAPDKIYLNDGTGRLVDATCPDHPQDQRVVGRVPPADLDGDGLIDLLYWNSIGLQVSWGDPATGFIPHPHPLLPSFHFPWWIGTTDLNGDGDQEVLYQAQDGHIYQVPNQGGRRFALPIRATGNVSTCIQKTAFGDVNGDKAHDLVIAVESGVFLLLGDGKGKLTASSSPPIAKDSHKTCSLDLGDLDGDGDLDLLRGLGTNSVFPFLFYRNLGNGRFSEMTSLFTNGGGIHGGHSNAARFLDLDRDGDLDVVSVGTPMLVCININGKFRSLFPGIDTPQFHTLVVGDLDDDGDPDLVTSQPTYGPNLQGSQVLLNDGYGHFQRAHPSCLPSNPSLRIFAMADLDGDGDTDLLGHSGSYDIRILRNLGRHILAPRLALVGRTYRLELCATGPERRGHSMIPLLAGRSGTTAIPGLGTLFLAPAQLIALAPRAIDAASGKAVVDLVIPNNPALMGGRFFIQGLHIPPKPSGFAGLRLTNVIEDTIGM